MSKIKIDKVVSVLPSTLIADTLYAVRTGQGFDLYFTDTTGVTAHKLNEVLSNSWIELCASSVIEPVQVGTIGSDLVMRYNNGATDYYRLLPEPYNASTDAFYLTYSGGVLSDLIASRIIQNI